MPAIVSCHQSAYICFSPSESANFSHQRVFTFVFTPNRDELAAAKGAVLRQLLDPKACPSPTRLTGPCNPKWLMPMGLAAAAMEACSAATEEATEVTDGGDGGVLGGVGGGDAHADRLRLPGGGPEPLCNNQC